MSLATDGTGAYRSLGVEEDVQLAKTQPSPDKIVEVQEEKRYTNKFF